MPNYAFTVTVLDEGGISLNPIEEGNEEIDVTRTATAFDILDASRKIVADLERQIIFDGVSQMLASLAPEPELTQQSIIAEALAKRAEEVPAPVSAKDHVANADPIADIVSADEPTA